MRPFQGTRCHSFFRDLSFLIESGGSNSASLWVTWLLSSSLHGYFCRVALEGTLRKRDFIFLDLTSRRLLLGCCCDCE